MSDATRPQVRSSILVLGDGGWGTALAMTLCRAGHRVSLWGYDAAYTREMRETRRNPRYLPGVELPEGLEVASDITELAPRAEIIVSVIPTQYLRSVLDRLSPHFPPDALVISATKGLERGTLLLPSRILEEKLAGRSIVVLSGPSHAEEVSRELPTTVVAASADGAGAPRVQSLFAGTRLRVYSNRDRLGVELGGAVKNVIAIASGISDGLGFGDNSRAAIVTRGLVEITRLGLAMGAQRATFSGLSGMGDLITTCTSQHSRNRAVGFRIGRGERLEDILRSTFTVAEGVETSRSVFRLARKHGVDMPITREVHAVLHEGRRPLEAVNNLMGRDLKEELEDLV
jgi:glycerol-3-phosphate dehydrogenase (NAD(P)+)